MSEQDKEDEGVRSELCMEPCLQRRRELNDLSLISLEGQDFTPMNRFDENLFKMWTVNVRFCPPDSKSKASVLNENS